MARQVVAFFACSFLTVSLTIPSMAEEAGGVVAQIDEESEILILKDGSRYRLPDRFDYQAVRPGMQVHLIYQPAEPAQTHS